MSTRYIQKFTSLDQIRSQGNDAGIGVVGDSAYAVVDGNVSVIGRVGYGTHYYFDPQNGDDDNNDGTSPGNAFATTAAIDAVLTHGDTVHVRGVVKENWAPGDFNDVTIIGEANQARQATDDGVANGAGATWLNPGTVASPLISIASSALNKPSQGWRFINIFFNNAGEAACVKLGRKVTGADSSHASFFGCKFTGVKYGIEAEEASFVTIVGCTFFDFTGSGDTGIKGLTVGVGNPPYRDWRVEDNMFSNNHTHMAIGLYQARIVNNSFTYVGSSITTTVQVNVTGGAANMIQNNYFAVAHDESSSATMFLPQSTANSWLNFYRGGLTALVPATA